MAGGSAQVVLKLIGDSSSLTAALGKAGAAAKSFVNSVTSSSSKVNSLGNNAQAAFSKVSGSAQKASNAVKQVGKAMPTKMQVPAGMSKLIDEANALEREFKQQQEVVKQAEKALAKYNTAIKNLGKSSGPKRDVLVANLEAQKKKLDEVAAASAAAGAKLFKATMTGGSGAQASQATLQASAGMQNFSSKVQNAVQQVKSLTAGILGFKNGATGGFSAAAGGALKLVGIFSILKKAFSGFSSGGGKGGGTSGLMAFAKGLDYVRQQAMNLNDTFRFMAQGITNFGRSMMFFVSLPLIAIFKGLVGGAIDFEDGMIRVQKTSGLADEQIAGLSNNLRELARSSATSHTELAGIAGVLGQMADWESMGAGAVDSLSSLTQTVQMFAVATDMSGTEVASSLGKIANAFGWNLGTSAEEVEKLANVINVLENKTAATAQEIITAVTEFAPFAKALNVSAADAAAFAAATVSVGLSANEAGTALKNMSIYVARNAEKVSEAMSGYSEDYSSADKVLQKMGTDSVQVFLDILDAASKSEDQIGSMLALMGIADLRGGRGMAALKSNVDLLRDSLKQARGEWVAQKSLIEEYERAMTSTKNQLAMLKNNVIDAGITIGDTLLPVINEVVKVAIPAVQMLAQKFAALPKVVQLQTIAIAGLVVVIGPLLMFFGQMLHAVTLIALGFGQATRLIVVMISALGQLGTVAAFAGRALLGIPGLVIGGMTLLMIALQKVGVDIAGFFTRLASSAQAWGQNLAAQIANGFLAGAVRFISAAISKVANMIASFFKGFSPPKKGPLSTIDKWGISVMNAYLQGFNQADFEILSGVGSMIQDMLTKGLEGNALAGALKKSAGAREGLAKLISGFNTTGVFDEGLLDSIISGLGEMGEKVKDLTRVWIQYNAIQERLKNIEKERKEVGRDYEAEVRAIGAGNMSLQDKIAAIREAQRNRDGGLSGLDEEEESLNEQSDELKAQLDFQKSTIDALQEQRDIYQQIADTLKNVSKSMEEMSNSMSEMGGGGGGGGGGMFDALENQLEEAGAKFDEIRNKVFSVKESLDDGRRALQAFLDGFNGKRSENPTKFWDRKGGPADRHNQFYEIGEQVREMKDKVVGAFTEIETKWNEFLALFQGGGGGGGIAMPPQLQGVIDFVETKWKSVEGSFRTGWALISAIFTSAGQAIGSVIDQLKPKFDNFKGALGPLKDAFGNLIEALKPFTPLLSMIASFVAGVLLAAFVMALGVITGLLTGLTTFFTGVVRVVTGITNIVSGIINSLVGTFELIKGIVTGNTALIEEAFTKLNDAAWQILGGIWQVIIGVWQTSIGALLGFVEGFVKGVIQFFTNLYQELVGGSIVPDMMADIVSTVRDGMADAVAAVTEKIREWVQAGRDLAMGIVEGLKSAISSVTAAVGEVAQSALDAFKSLLGISSPSEVFRGFGVEIINGIIVGLDSMVGAVIGKVTSIGSQIVDAARGIFGLGELAPERNKGKGISGQGGAKKGGNKNFSFTEDMVAQTQKDMELIQAAVLRSIETMKQAFSTLGVMMLKIYTPVYNFIKTTVEFLYNRLILLMETLYKKFDILKVYLVDLWDVLVKIEDQFLDIAETIEEIKPELLDPFLTALDQLNTKAMEVKTTLEGVAAAVESAVSAIGQLSAGSGQPDQSKGQGGAPKNQSGGQKSQGAQDFGLGGLKAQLQEVTAAAQAFTSSITSTMQSASSAVESAWLSVFEKMKAEVEKVKGAVEQMASSAKGKLEEVKGGVTNVTNAIKLAVTAVGGLQKGIGSLNGGSLNALISGFGRVQAAIRNATSSAQALIKVLQEAVSTANNITLPPAPKPKAAGGPVSMGSTLLVGELGPEIFVPSVTGTIIPNDKLGGLGCGATINVSINNPVVRNDEDIDRLADMVARKLADTLNKRNRYGGIVR